MSTRFTVSESKIDLALDWVKKRIPVDVQELKTITNEPVPNHLKHWWFALGGTPAILFGIQIVTGIFLLFYYVPTPEEAYSSVSKITHEVKFGWYIRSLHKWASELMIVTVILHMARVYFTNAYRKPRELNWMVGVVIFFIVLGLGFTGYSLIYDQLSYWAAVVGTEIAHSVPIVGPLASDFIRGGPEVGANTLTRLYVFHVVIFPAALASLVGLHIIFVRLHGVTEFEFDEEKSLKHKTYPLFPDHVMTELILVMLIFYILSMMSVIFPAGLGERADPLSTPEHIKPEWYFYASFKWLKLTNVYLGILGQIFFAAMIFFWPFIDQILVKLYPKYEMSIIIGFFGFTFYLVLTVWEAIT
jgi:quinol-cytochrome oxidoreductase complex cytochrome b subunit